MAKPSRWMIALSIVAVVILSVHPNVLAQDSPAAANAPDYSKEPSIMERVAVKLIFNNDGRYTEEATIRVRIQSQAAVQNYGLLHFPFASAMSTMEVVYVRVIRPDDSVVRTPAGNILEMPADITRQAPVYSDLKDKQVPVRGLSVGSVLEYQYRSQVHTPVAPGHFWFSYDFVRSGITLDEELQVSVPRTRGVTVKSAHVQPTVTDQDGVRIYSWKTANLQPRSAQSEENNAATSEKTENHSVQLTTFHTWDEVGQWFKSLASPQAAVSPAIQAKATELTLTAKTDSEKIHALYDFVSTKFRYIGISLGIGRYQPHIAEDVLDNEYGDCKDKHTLFAALLSAVGIRAYPVLINSALDIDSDVPNPGQFDHVITAVQQDGAFVYLDTTPEVAPFGLLLASLRDKKALLIPGQGAATLVQTPANPPFKPSFTFQADATLDASGTLASKIRMALRGDSEVLYRLALREADQTQWKEVLQKISANLGFGGTVDEVTATSPDVTNIPFEIHYSYTRKEYSDWANRRILPPVPGVFLPAAPDATDQTPAPIRLGTPEESLYQASVKLPAGSAPSVPATLDLREPFADYHAEYSFADGTMRFERRLQTKLREVPVAQIDAYRRFYKAVVDDATTYVALSDKADSSTAASAAGPGSGWTSQARALMEQGRNAVQRRDLPAAADAFQRTVDADPQFAPGWHALAGIHMMMRNYDQAVPELKKAIQLNPDEERSYEFMASDFESQRRDHLALEIWRALKTARPEDPHPPEHIAAILMKQKLYSEVVKELDPLVQQRPDPTLLLRLGEAYLHVGDREKGAASIVKAAGIDQGATLLTAAARALADSNVRLDDALKFARDAATQAEGASGKISLDALTLEDIRAMPTLASAWDAVGWVQFQLGHLDVAEKYLSAAWNLTLDPVMADHLGQVYEKTGRKHDAALAYARALASSDPAPEETESRLDGVQKGAKFQEVVRPDPIELQELRTFKMPQLTATSASAEFFLLLAPGPKVVNVKFVGGSEQLRSATRNLAATRFDVPFPAEGSVQILRRGLLSCGAESRRCIFVLFPPNSVNSVK